MKNPGNASRSSSDSASVPPPLPGVGRNPPPLPDVDADTDAAIHIPPRGAVARSQPPPLPTAVSPSLPPPPSPPPPPKIVHDPLPDFPTRHLLISQPEQPIGPRPTPATPTLAAPGSWAAEDGTAALILPRFDMTPPPDGRLAVKSAPPVGKNQRLPQIVVAAIGAMLMLVGTFVAGRLWQLGPLAPTTIAAPQRQLIDEALFAVQSGHLRDAIGLLERYQKAQPAPDAVVEQMIAALKRRLP